MKNARLSAGAIFFVLALYSSCTIAQDVDARRLSLLDKIDSSGAWFEGLEAFKVEVTQQRWLAGGSGKRFGHEAVISDMVSNIEFPYADVVWVSFYSELSTDLNVDQEEITAQYALQVKDMFNARQTEPTQNSQVGPRAFSRFQGKIPFKHLPVSYTYAERKPPGKSFEKFVLSLLDDSWDFSRDESIADTPGLVTYRLTKSSDVGFGMYELVIDDSVPNNPLVVRYRYVISVRGVTRYSKEEDIAGTMFDIQTSYETVDGFDSKLPVRVSATLNSLVPKGGKIEIASSIKMISDLEWSTLESEFQRDEAQLLAKMRQFEEKLKRQNR